MTKTLEITLKRTLQRLICLKSFKAKGVSFMRIKTIRVLVKPGLSVPVAKALFTRLKYAKIWDSVYQ